MHSVAETDGTEFVHNDPRKKKKTHYDQVWDALERTPLKMMGDHEYKGETYVMRDANNQKIGQVSFDKENKMSGAVFMGEHFISGRIATQRDAFHELIRRIEDIYG